MERQGHAAGARSDRGRSRGCSPARSTYHQGSLRGVPLAEFKPRNGAPLVIGTPCRMLATYVVFQNHLPMMADYPSAYRGHPLTNVLVEHSRNLGRHAGLAAKVGRVCRHRPSPRRRLVDRSDDRPRARANFTLPLDVPGSTATYEAEIYQMISPRRIASKQVRAQ